VTSAPRETHHHVCYPNSQSTSSVSNRSLKGNLAVVHKDPEEKNSDIWDTWIWQTTA